MRSRRTRLAVIVDILNHNKIGCQDELLKHLATRGFIVTQATLSRDLKKLRTVKAANDLGGYIYVVPPTIDSAAASRREQPVETMQSALHPAAQSLAISGNMVVIKTRNGYASGLAYDLDMLQSPLLLGTIPGADTVFAVMAEGVTRAQILELLANFLPAEVLAQAR